MKSNRNIIAISLGSDERSAKIKEKYEAIADKHFAKYPSTLLTELVKEIVAAFDVETLDESERLGLFNQAALGPRTCYKVIKAYGAKAEKFKRELDEYRIAFET